MPTMPRATVRPPLRHLADRRPCCPHTCKCLLPTREDDGPHSGVLLKGVQCPVELHHQAIAERVECFGAVQLDQPHVAVLPLLFCDEVLKVSTWGERGQGISIHVGIKPAGLNPSVDGVTLTCPRPSPQAAAHSFQPHGWPLYQSLPSQKCEHFLKLQSKPNNKEQPTAAFLLLHVLVNTAQNLH